MASVETANRLFQNAQTEYIDVLFAQRDLWDARAILIDTNKAAELSAIINTYQALGERQLFDGECPSPPPPETHRTEWSPRWSSSGGSTGRSPALAFAPSELWGDDARVGCDQTWVR